VKLYFTSNMIILRLIQLIVVARKKRQIIFEYNNISNSHPFTIINKIIDGYLLSIHWINTLEENEDMCKRRRSFLLRLFHQYVFEYHVPRY